MKRVRGQLVEIMVSHAHRAGNPASRPEGSREVRLFLATTVTPRLPPSVSREMAAHIAAVP